MMQCQYCGDQNGPWVHSSKHGLLCEDCYELFDTIDRLEKLVKKRYDKENNKLAVCSYMDQITNEVYNRLGIR